MAQDPSSPVDLAARVAQLEQENRILQAMLDTVPDAIVYKNADLTIEYANRAFREWFGLPLEQFRVAEDRSSDDVYASEYQSHDRQVLRSGLGSEFEERSNAPDGSLITTRSIKQPVRDANQVIGLVAVLRDVTSAAQASRSLSETQARLSRIISNVPGMVFQFVLHPDGSSEFPYVSEGIRQAFGIEPERLTSERDALYNWVHPEDQPEFIRSFVESGQLLEAWQWEGRVVYDGVVRWVRGASRPTRTEAGDILWDGVLMDITAQRENEVALRRLQNRLQQFLDATPVGLYVIDPEGKPYYANAKAQELLGQNAMLPVSEQTETYRTYKVGSETIYPREELPTQRALRGEIVHLDDLEFRYTGKPAISIEVFARPIYDTNNEIEYAIATFFDITERRQIAQELLDWQQRFDLIMSTVELVMYDYDVFNNRIEWSDSVTKILGYPKAEFSLSVDAWAAGIHPEDAPEALRLLDVAQSACSSYAVEYRFLHHAGHYIWLLDRGFFIPNKEGVAVRMLGLVQDMTERKQAEVMRDQIQGQIIEAQAAALRELSTPLIPINERTVIMPLIGSIDSARASQIVESLLQGVSQMNAGVVILDLTGVPVVDTQVAGALLQAARAVRLLGAEVVLTGIRPEIAQTLVSLGINLNDVVTLSNLQSGIERALNRRLA
ncbi:PAS domain S-box protein [Herpetosiphon llansteffanensis]